MKACKKQMTQEKENKPPSNDPISIPININQKTQKSPKNLVNYHGNATWGHPFKKPGTCYTTAVDNAPSGAEIKS